ncbi:MAG: hypothetical protein GQ570_11595 [Helicobacteraceae bacterium]|nr:hypothetical protein [Helicobacteraceae bacterium]
MGWSCQHDFKGECKLLSKLCVPGMKGCVIVKAGYVVSSGSFEEDLKSSQSENDKVDFKELAKSN